MIVSSKCFCRGTVDARFVRRIVHSLHNALPKDIRSRVDGYQTTRPRLLVDSGWIQAHHARTNVRECNFGVGDFGLRACLRRLWVAGVDHTECLKFCQSFSLKFKKSALPVVTLSTEHG